VHTARNCRDELRAGIGNPPLPANEHLIHQLPAADAIIAPVNGPHVAFPEYLVDLGGLKAHIGVDSKQDNVHSEGVYVGGFGGGQVHVAGLTARGGAQGIVWCTSTV